MASGKGKKSEKPGSHEHSLPLLRQKLLAGYLFLVGKTDEIFLHWFLLAREGRLSRNYDFVPSGKGPYSFTLQNDLEVLERKGFFEVKEGQRVLEVCFRQLTKEDQDELVDFAKAHPGGKEDRHEMMIFIQREEPFFIFRKSAPAAFSEGRVAAPPIEYIGQRKPRLFTIGYESKTPEVFLCQLLKKDVKALADVRWNRLSMKYGFSAGTLEKFCALLGISYLSFSELGIRSEKRRDLEGKDAHDRLLAEYARDLSHRRTSVEKLREALKTHQRVAVMCYELDPLMCHRSALVKQVVLGLKCPVEHL